MTTATSRSPARCGIMLLCGGKSNHLRYHVVKHQHHEHQQTGISGGRATMNRKGELRLFVSQASEKSLGSQRSSMSHVGVTVSVADSHPKAAVVTRWVRAFADEWCTRNDDEPSTAMSGVAGMSMSGPAAVHVTRRVSAKGDEWSRPRRRRDEWCRTA